MKASIIGVATIFAVGILAGCQSDTALDSRASDSTQAVICAKCQVTWTKRPRREKGRIVAYTTRKSVECPDCRRVAEGYFASGKLQPCPTCGDAMEVCTMK